MFRKLVTLGLTTAATFTCAWPVEAGCGKRSISP
jgi:hypothetical protein